MLVVIIVVMMVMVLAFVGIFFGTQQALYIL
jgi:hypothetical protein